MVEAMGWATESKGGPNGGGGRPGGDEVAVEAPQWRQAWFWEGWLSRQCHDQEQLAPLEDSAAIVAEYLGSAPQ